MVVVFDGTGTIRYAARGRSVPPAHLPSGLRAIVLPDEQWAMLSGSRIDPATGALVAESEETRAIRAKQWQHAIRPPIMVEEARRSLADIERRLRALEEAAQRGTGIDASGSAGLVSS